MEVKRANSPMHSNGTFWSCHQFSPNFANSFFGLEFNTDLTHTVIEFCLFYFPKSTTVPILAHFDILIQNVPLECIGKFDLLTSITFEPVEVWRSCASHFTSIGPKTFQKSLDSKLEFPLLTIWLLTQTKIKAQFEFDLLARVLRMPNTEFALRHWAENSLHRKALFSHRDASRRVWFLGDNFWTSGPISMCVDFLETRRVGLNENHNKKPQKLVIVELCPIEVRV